MTEKLYCRVPTVCRLSTYQIKRLETLALRPTCAPIFLPLYDHLLSLAADSRARFVWGGHAYHAQRAGRELFQARKVAGYAVCSVCGQPIVRGTDRCSADESHDARGAFQALREAIVADHARAAAEPCPCQASLNASW